MWSSDSLEQWLSLWSGTGDLWVGLLVMVAGCYVVAFRLQRWDRARAAAPAPATRRLGKPAYHWRMAAPTVLGAAALLLVGSPAFYSNLGNTLGNVIETARDASRLNERDRKRLEQGYYEQLLSVNVTSGLFEMQIGEAPENERDDSAVWQETNNVLNPALRPGTSTLFKGQAFTVNSHGMRDREYALQKPPGTVRVALLGSSHTMGSGVADGEPFEALVEERLNSGPAGQAPRYELLNFAVGGYSVLQSLYLLQTKVARFAPDVVVVVGHLQDAQRLLDSMSNLVHDGIPIHYPALTERLKAAGIEPGMPAGVVRHRLQPVLGELQRWIYASIATEARRQGAVPVWVFLPAPYQHPSAEELDVWLQVAAQAGFTALSLAGAYDAHSTSEVQVSKWDTHPNALGHRLVAERFYQVFNEAGLLQHTVQASGRGISRAVQ
jgi:hypothetical protein